MFGRKQAGINRLRSENDALRTKLTNLARDLREMDQLVYQMSQQTSWAGMQPLFARLLDITRERMRAESDTIRSALIPQIVETYANESQRRNDASGRPTKATASPSHDLSRSTPKHRQNQLPKS